MIWLIETSRLIILTTDYDSPAHDKLVPATLKSLMNEWSQVSGGNLAVGTAFLFK